MARTVSASHPRPANVPLPSCEARFALVARLGRQFDLDRSERGVLARALTRNVRSVGDRVALVAQGDAPGDIAVVLEGWARRYRDLGEGRRQLLAIYLPGDLCDFDVFTMNVMDSTIEAVGPLKVAGISRALLNELTAQTPRIGQALWWTSLANASIQRAWTWNVATRSAEARIAHLTCELLTRLWLAGIGDGHRAACALAQADLAAACGMTAEHTNRTLRVLRDRGLMQVDRRGIAVIDPVELARLARFDPSYLHASPGADWPLKAPDDAKADAEPAATLLFADRLSFG